jgi:hypothetical protein
MVGVAINLPMNFHFSASYPVLYRITLCHNDWATSRFPVGLKCRLISRKSSFASSHLHTNVRILAQNNAVVGAQAELR